jgi:hypothetical protein
MVELRKRPSRDPPPAQPAAKRGSGSGGRMKKVVEKAKEVVGAGTSTSLSVPTLFTAFRPLSRFLSLLTSSYYLLWLSFLLAPANYGSACDEKANR